MSVEPRDGVIYLYKFTFDLFGLLLLRLLDYVYLYLCASNYRNLLQLYPRAARIYVNRIVLAHITLYGSALVMFTVCVRYYPSI